MRHPEEIKREIKWYEDNIHYDEYDSYGESLMKSRQRACQKMLEYVLKNDLLNEGELNKLYKKYSKIWNEIERYAKKHGGDYQDDDIAYIIKGHLNAIVWLLEKPEIKKILESENKEYNKQKEILYKRIWEIEEKIINNNCILSTLDKK